MAALYTGRTTLRAQLGKTILRVLTSPSTASPSKFGQRQFSGFTGTRPLILLDIDGVINCPGLGRGDASEAASPHCVPRWTAEDRGQAALDGYNVVWARPAVARINAWLDHADIMWMTSWGTLADTSFAPCVGLDPNKRILPMPCIHTFNNISKGDKMASMHKVWKELPETRPLVWIDDELGKDGQEGAYVLKWMDSMAPGWITKRAHTLLVAPAFRYGIHGMHLDRVDAFLREYSGSSSGSSDNSTPAASHVV